MFPCEWGRGLREGETERQRETEGRRERERKREREREREFIVIRLILHQMKYLVNKFSEYFPFDHNCYSVRSG